jgi:hypothetical protein
MISKVKIKINYKRKQIKTNKTVKSVLRTISLDQFQVYQEKYAETDPAPGYSKYLDIQHWMADSLQYVFRLDLNRSKPLNILDLGTGCGYFPYLCQYFGHSTLTVDLDIVPMYNEITSFLKLDRKIWNIKTYEKLPDFGRRFNLVTALSVCFNHHNKPDLWDVNEWAFFLEDLAQNQLTEDGQIFLKLNEEKKDKRFYTDSLFDYFKHKGALIDGRYVYFPAVKAFIEP